MAFAGQHVVGGVWQVAVALGYRYTRIRFGGDLDPGSMRGVSAELRYHLRPGAAPIRPYVGALAEVGKWYGSETLGQDDGSNMQMFGGTVGAQFGLATSVRLHVAAFDLARGADGEWRVAAQRTQAPSGLGYLLENRLIVSQQFPGAFRDLHVQRVAAGFLGLLQGLQRLSPAGEDARVVLLTPGPHNETYFEHAFLARYLGITLVETTPPTYEDPVPWTTRVVEEIVPRLSQV